MTTIEQTLTIKENGKLEIHSPELRAGTTVKIVVAEQSISFFETVRNLRLENLPADYSVTHKPKTQS
jgi:hypothetical protein